MTRPNSQRFLIAAGGFLLFWLFGRYLFPVLLPFLLAIPAAFAAEPLVNGLCRRLKLKRSIASAIGMLLTLGILLLGLFSLTALLLRQLSRLAGVLPDLETTALSGMASLEDFLVDLAAKSPKSLRPILTHSVEGFFSDGTQVLDQATGKLLQLASGVLTRIPDSFLGFGTWLLACFMLSARLPQLRQALQCRIPDSFRNRYFPAFHRLKKNLLGWLLAQVKLTGITFLLLCASFFLLRISHPLLLAAVISVVDALPILGTGTVLIPWSLVCLLQSNPVGALGLLGTYAIVALVRSVLEPRLVGKQLGLDPLVTLLSLYTGYRLWGLGGMLLAPVLAVTFRQLSSLPEGQ